MRGIEFLSFFNLIIVVVIVVAYLLSPFNVLLDLVV